MKKITKQELGKILINYRCSDLMRVREQLYKSREEFLNDILKYSAKEIEIAMSKINYLNNYYRDMDGRRGEPSYPTTFNKDSTINVNPHYSDEDFQNKEQTIFGKKEKNLHYVYSDRLRQWDCKKHEKSRDIADKSEKKSNTCAYYEIYLSGYYDKLIEIKHIIAGVSRATGYSYLVFGYIEKENSK